MKTKNGTSYHTLLTEVITTDLSFDEAETMAKAISERVASGKKPAATFERCLEQMDLHREHWSKALAKLKEAYTNMVTPQQRTSVVDSTRHKMLAAMPDKMLKQFAESMEVDTSDFILPDDKDRLITVVVEMMKE